MTTKYMETWKKRREMLLRILRGDSMTAKGPEMSHLAKLGKSERVDEMLENYGFLKRMFGGGGQIRTVDSADMSRVSLQ
jgi:hypothetical protein